MAAVQKNTATTQNAKRNIENQNDLNREAEIFENFVVTVCHIPRLGIQKKKSGPNKQKLSRANRNNKNEIRGLYDQQNHRAIQEILFGPTYFCRIDKDKIQKHYKELLSTETECNIGDLQESLWQKDMPNQRANSMLIKEFTSNEVKTKLSTKIYHPLYSSRSTGLDRISFQNLRTADPRCSIMALLFNYCLELQSVPEMWMEFYSVLVKANDKDDSKIENWRPITMQRTVSKLFQTALAARLIVWAKVTQRLSATQKGFLMNNAACESSFILQECKNNAVDKRKDLTVAWLDFKNASDFISQKAVLHALNKHNVPSSIIKIIQNMLQFAKTKIRTLGTSRYTDNIKISKGLPQGSPLNPILLDLVIEPVLRDLLSAESDVFQMYNKKINHYAIPNELTLIADSPSKLQNLLHLVEKNAKLIGLKFNIDMCSTYHYNGEINEVKMDSSFSFFNKKLNILPEEKIEEYFGVKQGLSIGQEGCPTVQEMIDSIEAINSSLLDSYQKTESILIYILPRVENCLRGLQNFNAASFEKVDEILKDKFKDWLDLPSDITVGSIVYHVWTIKNQMRNPIMYDYLPFTELFYIMKVIHALQMLRSKDDIVRTIAFESLTAEVKNVLPKKKKNSFKKQHLAQYLSGELNIENKKSNSMWCIVREATLKLKIKIPLSWKYNGETIQLIVKNENEKRNTTLTANNPSNAEEKLKNTLVNYYIHEIKKKNPDSIDNIKTAKAGAKKKTSGIKRSSSVQKSTTDAVEPPLSNLAHFPMLYKHF